MTSRTGRSSQLPPPSPDWALFLDFDGTLVAIAPRPEAVRLDARLPLILRRLSTALDGALAVVSGRRLADLDGFFGALRLPAAGLHGLERRRADGSMVEAEIPADIPTRLRTGLATLAQQHPGSYLEDKGRTLALHYRQAPQHEAPIRAGARRLAADIGEAVRLIEGKMVVELQPRQADKGQAILAFMSEHPFRGRRPVFAGDDVTDEDGFAAVNHVGGISVRVGTERATAARWQIADVPALAQWLGEVADRLAPATTP